MHNILTTPILDDHSIDIETTVTRTIHVDDHLAKAREILFNAYRRVDRQLVTRVGYLEIPRSQHRSDDSPQEDHTLCEGAKACAVGALYLAADIVPIRDGGGAYLPGVKMNQRAAFLLQPGNEALYLAMRAANQAAQSVIDTFSFDCTYVLTGNDESEYIGNYVNNTFADWPLERLFEADNFSHEERNTIIKFVYRRALFLLKNPSNDQDPD